MSEIIASLIGVAGTIIAAIITIRATQTHQQRPTVDDDTDADVREPSDKSRRTPQGKRRQRAAPPARSNLPIVIITLLLVVVLAAGACYVVFILNNESSAPPIAQEDPQPSPPNSNIAPEKLPTVNPAPKTKDITPTKTLPQLKLPPRNWQPGPAPTIPGLLPNPAKLNGVGRWQIDTTAPTELSTVALNPDGTRFTCGAAQGSVRIYETKTGRLQQLLTGHSYSSLWQRWSPDGKYLFSRGGFDCFVWDLSTGKRNAIPTSATPASPGSLSWSRDSSRFALVDNIGTLRFFKANGTLDLSIPVNKNDENAYFYVDWNPARDTLSLATKQNQVFIWTLGEKKIPVGDSKQSKYTRDIAWSSDGKTLATYDRLGNIELWDEQGKKLNSLSIADQGKPHVYRLLGWLPGNRKLMMSGLGIFDLENQKITKVRSTAEQVTWDRQGDLLLLDRGQQNRDSNIFRAALDSIDDNAEMKLLVQRRPVAGVACHPDGEVLCVAVAGEMGIRFWTTTGEIHQTVPMADSIEEAMSPTWSPNGKWLVTRGNKGLKAWNRDGKLLRSHETYRPQFVAWTRDSRLAFLLNENTFLWNLESGIVVPISESKGRVYSFAVNPTGDQFAYGEKTGLCIRDTKGALLQVIKGNFSEASWSPGGEWIAAVSPGATNSKDLHILSPDGSADVRIDARRNRYLIPRWSQDGSRVAHLRLLDQIGISNAEGGQFPFQGASDSGITDLCWHPNPNWLLSASFDSTVRLWNTETSEQEWIAIALPDNQAAVFSNAGELLFKTENALQHLVYWVEESDGRIVGMTHDEFSARVGKDTK